MKKFFLFSLIFFSVSFLPSFALDENESFVDEIRLEDNIPFEIRVNKENFFDTYLQKSKEENNRLEYKKGNISFFSDSKQELNDYMTNDYKSGMHARYGKEKFSLTGGYEVGYRNPDANINTKKLYFSPSLNLRDDFSLSFSSKVNPDNKDFEQEVGFNYAPKFIKNTKFGVKAGAVLDEGNIKSQNVKFNTDLFVF